MIVKFYNSSPRCRRIPSGGDAGELKIALFAFETRFSPGVSIFITSLAAHFGQTGLSVMPGAEAKNEPAHYNFDTLKNLAANLATLKHISFNVLKRLDIKPSIRVRRKLAGWDNNFIFNVLKTQAMAAI